MVQEFNLETEVGMSVEVKYNENEEDYIVDFPKWITRAELIELTEEIKRITKYEEPNITN